MAKLYWFTHTNIDIRKVKDKSKLITDLTPFLSVFIENRIWERKTYQSEYTKKYNIDDLKKIKSIQINIHAKNGPYSNLHSYEDVLGLYIDLNKLEGIKIASSNIGIANWIAVIEVEFDNEFNLIPNLNHREEKDVEKIMERLSQIDNIKSWDEISRIKSIICEFLQFFMFNLHLTYLSKDYELFVSSKSTYSGFTVVEDSRNLFSNNDYIDFLSHYILYEENNNQLKSLMSKTILFWHKEINTIHFFLDALKGNHININSFSKLMFTIESFFGQRTSNDFMTFAIPLLIGKNIADMKSIKELLTKCFATRNDYVHGGKISMMLDNFDQMDKTLFDRYFELKNIIIRIFYFYINNDLFTSRLNRKINHEFLFEFFPKGLCSSKTNKLK